MKIFSGVQNFSKSLLDKSHEKHEVNSTILGGILYFFALGGIGTWGNLNLYFFSYFKTKAHLSSPSQMNLILPIVAIPVATLSIFSIQIAEKLGFRKIIITSAFLYSLSTIISSFIENIYLFTLLYNFIPALALAASMNPAIYCVWSAFPQIKGKISGYMFGVFQISTLFYTLVATIIINPRNISATEQSFDEHNNVVNYYNNEVTSNLGKMILVLGIIYFFFGVLGGYLIKPVLENEKEKEEEKQSSEIEMNAPGNNKYEAFMEEKSQQIIKVQAEELKKDCPNVRTGIKTRTFGILFINSALVAALALYLNINFKAFSLTRLNNDYYVTYLYFFNAVSGGVGRLFWGYIIDKYPFRSVLIFLEVMVFMNGIIFPFAKSAVLYCIMVFFLAFFDGGLISIIGPGLMSIYGLNVGAKLLPIKGLSFFLSLIICPIIGMLLEGKIGIEKVFLVLGFLNIIGVVLSFFIKTSYNWYKKPNEGDSI